MDIIEVLQSVKADINKVIDSAIASIESGDVSITLPSVAAAINTVGGVRLKSKTPYTVHMPDGTVIAEITGQRTFELALQAFFKNPENKKLIPGNAKCEYDISQVFGGTEPIIALKRPVRYTLYNQRGTRWYRRGLKIKDQIVILEFLGMKVVK